MMQESLGQFDAPLHASGKSFDALFRAVGEADTREDFLYAILERRTFEAVQMALMPEILIGSELGIDALRLEHHSDLAAKSCGILGGIAAHDQSPAGGRNHQG